MHLSGYNLTHNGLAGGKTHEINETGCIFVKWPRGHL